MHCKNKRKPHQDAVYWIHLARVQEKGVQFLVQTRSHAMIVYDSVLADCIGKVKETKLYVREFPRLVQLRRWFSKMLGNYHSSSSNSSSSMARSQAQGNLQRSSTRAHKQAQENFFAEENPFLIALRIQGIPQDAVLEDQGRRTKHSRIGCPRRNRDARSKVNSRSYLFRTTS